MVDVVVVGAGAAGIGAGMELAARGLSFVIVEASNRIGGRAYTDRTSLPGHWDQGGQWFHCADVNPLVPIADRLGWVFDREDRIDKDMSFDGTRWLDAAQGAALDHELDAAFAAIYGAAALGQDVALTSVLQPDRAGIVDFVLRLMSSEDPDKISTLGYADYADTGVNLIVTQGLGALIEHLSQGLPIRTGVAVTKATEHAKGVQLATSAGVIDARAAIVTASTNVLASGAIDFGQGPAESVLDLLQNLPCGVYEKLALAFDQLPFDPQDLLFCDLSNSSGPLPFHFQISAGKTPKLIAHFGGRDARAVAAMDLADLTALGKDALTAAFGSSAAQSVTASARTEWSANPWTRGAYSYSRVGTGNTRRSLAAANTGAIRFAGEAFSVPWHSTVHGAWQSGKDAAGDVATVLTKAG